MRRAAPVRVALSGLAAIVALVPTSVYTPGVSVVRVTMIVWLLLSVSFWIAARDEKWARRLIAFPPLVDLLLIGMCQVSQIQVLLTEPHPPDMEPKDLAVSVMPYLCGLMLMSAFSLSKWVIYASAVVSGTLMMAIMSMTLSFSLEFLFVLIVPVGMALILNVLISRLGHLVAESRKKDLLGKYVLGERLGTGGMAEVYSATYCPEGGFVRKVAVKKILPSFATNPEAIALFRREAELGSMLAHPNLVQILDFGADGQTYFIALEYIDGVTLSQLLGWLRTTSVQLPVTALTYLAWCLGDALHAIHEHVTPTGQAMRLLR